MRLIKSAILAFAFASLVATIAPAQSMRKPQNDTRRSSGPQSAPQKAPERGQAPERSFDQGIYAPSPSGSGMCGAIVSYNFSAGDNPELQSVTTCTPNDAVVPQRARQQKPWKSPTPQVLQTDLRY
jgi:hypothetical protein